MVTLADGADGEDLLVPNPNHHYVPESVDEDEDEDEDDPEPEAK